MQTIQDDITLLRAAAPGGFEEIGYRIIAGLSERGFETGRLTRSDWYAEVPGPALNRALAELLTALVTPGYTLRYDPPAKAIERSGLDADTLRLLEACGFNDPIGWDILKRARAKTPGIDVRHVIRTGYAIRSLEGLPRLPHNSSHALVEAVRCWGRDPRLLAQSDNEADRLEGDRITTIIMHFSELVANGQMPQDDGLTLHEATAGGLKVGDRVCYTEAGTEAGTLVAIGSDDVYPGTCRVRWDFDAETYVRPRTESLSALRRTAR